MDCGSEDHMFRSGMEHPVVESRGDGRRNPLERYPRGWAFPISIEQSHSWIYTHGPLQLALCVQRAEAMVGKPGRWQP